MDETPCDVICQAVEDENWDVINEFINNGGSVNTSFISSGPNAGYTPVHHAVFKGKTHHVEMLVNFYGADVNCKEHDGTRPLHIACLCCGLAMSRLLLELGADVDAKFTEYIFDKYNIDDDYNWSDNFGGTLTLLTYAVINKYSKLVEILLEFGANVKIKDKNNKTLLMYALENEDSKSVSLLIKYMKNNLELIDARDANGKHAVHYLLPDKIFGNFRYNRNLCYDEEKDEFLMELIEAGADVNAMVNNDPDTLLLNVAAFRSAFSILNVLMDLDVYFSAEAKPLNYLMLPVNSEKFVENCKDEEDIKTTTNECLEMILSNLVLRHQLEMFVAKEDKDLMEELVDEDRTIKEVVNNFREKYIDNLLKKEKIRYGNESMTVYDLAVKVFNKRSLKLIVKNEKITKGFNEFYVSNKTGDYEDKFLLYGEMYYRINKASKRRKLMDEVEKISHLRKVIPLPYEIILMIVEYLDNDNLKNFVNSFYQNPVCE